MPAEINEIIRSKRKTLAILVNRDGTVVVRAPLRTSDKAIWDFVRQHSAWIERKRAQVQAFVDVPPRQYVPGERFLFLGKVHPLEIIKNQKQLLLLDGSFKLAESAHNNAETVFERWYRAQAKRILPERVDFYVNRYGFAYQGMKITSARTRWGSCSSRGSLNFSWRLILAPIEQVDYVVVHELVHTIHHDHSRRFWKKLETILPDFKERKAWLRKHGQLLMV